MVTTIIQQLHAKFKMKNLGSLYQFLGIIATPSTKGIFITQHQYALDLLFHVGMADCHSLPNPTTTKLPLNSLASTPYSNPTQYRQLVDAL